MPFRKVQQVIDPELPIGDAILFVISKSPGVRAIGIAARLRSYGWVRSNEYVKADEIRRKLAQLEGEGLISVDKRSSRYSYWPRGADA